MEPRGKPGRGNNALCTHTKKRDLILHKTVNYYTFCMIENKRVLKSAKGTDIRRQRIYGTAEIPVPSALGSFAVHYSFAFLCVCVWWCWGIWGRLG